MSNIIQFPKKYDDISQIKNWISNVCQRSGLTEPMIQSVIEQYLELHSQLFKKYEAELTLDDIHFSQDQVELIAKSHSETIQKVFDFHSAQMAYAAHCIIGLLAREQLNGVR